MSKRRVVITGVGVVSSIGIGKDAFWQGILESKNGISVVESFDTTNLAVHFAGEVKNFDPLELMGAKEARHVDRFVQFALSCAQQAVNDSGLDFAKEDTLRCGCIWASGIGGLTEIEATHRVALEKGPRRINPFFIPKLMINAGAGQIAIRFGLRGVNFGVASACASAKHALGLAYKLIQYGDADLVLTGGSEATVTMLGIGGFASLKALSERNDDPATASRPFNIDRDGFVVGEGGGALVFEEYERAKRRGAPIYAEVAGFGMTDDGFHISAPLPDGGMAVEAMRLAMKQAGIAPEAIDYVNAHGTSTPLNDVMETRAIHQAFGAHAKKLAVSSTKSQIGHLLGASGAAEGVALALALKHQIAPPTINYINPDPDCDLDYVPNVARPMKIRYGISNSFGFGGHNASIIFGTCP
jgi:3-oxoacyl-[acyl-carrier-protein] synthase II